MRSGDNTDIAALHHEEIEKASQRITRLIPYINNYNWKDRFSSTTKRL